MNRKVTITVPGAEPRTVTIQQADIGGPETLEAISCRLKVEDWSGERITEWWVDGKFVEPYGAHRTYLSDGMNIVGTAVRQQLGIAFVKIMIMGNSPRMVTTRRDETLGDLVSRLSSHDLPLNRVPKWHVNSHLIPTVEGYGIRDKSYILRDGDTIAGMPRLSE